MPDKRNVEATDSNLALDRTPPEDMTMNHEELMREVLGR
jgi:hypothetical protein